MEIAKGSINLSPENRQYKYDITPAEAMILHRLHFKNANGSPLHNDFKVYGEAVTITVPAKPKEESYYNAHSGKTVPEVPAKPAVSHKRTNGEEVARLRRKYTGVVKNDGGQNVPVFQAVFGSGTVIRLPQTFDDIEEALGMAFPPLDKAEPVTTESETRRRELVGKRRHELVAIALKLKIKVGVEDENAQIADKILAASPAEVEELEVNEGSIQSAIVAELNAKTVAELKDYCERYEVALTGDEKKADIIAAILAKVSPQPN